MNRIHYKLFMFLALFNNTLFAQNKIMLNEFEYLKIKLDILSLQLNSKQIRYLDIGETSFDVLISVSQEKKIEFTFWLDSSKMKIIDHKEELLDNSIVVFSAISDLMESIKEIIPRNYEILGFYQNSELAAINSKKLIWKDKNFLLIE